MDSSAELIFDEQSPIISQVRTIIETRQRAPRQWWEQLRADQELTGLVSSSVGAGFFDGLPLEDREALEPQLCVLLGQYRLRIRDQIVEVSQQVGQLAFVCKNSPFFRYIERYNLKGRARVYRSVVAGLLSYPDLKHWLGKELGEGAVVADLCGGTGQISSRLLASTGCRQLVFDLSSGMLRDGVQSGYLNRAVPVLANVEQLPLAKESVSCCLLIFGLDTVAHPRQLMLEVTRVLAARGQLVLVTPLPFRYRSDGVEFVAPQDRIGPGDEWLQDAVCLSRYLNEVGLQVTRWGVTTYYHSDIRGLKQSAAFVFIIQHSSIVF